MAAKATLGTRDKKLLDLVLVVGVCYSDISFSGSGRPLLPEAHPLSWC